MMTNPVVIERLNDAIARAVATGHMEPQEVKDGKVRYGLTPMGVAHHRDNIFRTLQSMRK